MATNKKYKKKITVLSLDGGGIRGIITCIILKYIEEQLQCHRPDAKLGDYFDMIAGSSTGGLLTAILLTPNEEKKAKYSVQTAFDLYAKKGEDIFNVSLWERIINPFGLFNEKISQRALEKHLLDFFGDLELKDLVKPCVITSYDMNNRCVKVFNTTDGFTPVDNFYVRDICRATSAAPTYFEPAQITSLYGQNFTLIDGGVYANNPALCAYAEVRKMRFSNIFMDPLKPDYPTANDLIMVSVSSGTVLKPYYFKDFKNAGKIKWIKPLIDILLSSNAEAVDYQLHQMFETLGVRNRKNYYRIRPDLREASPDMDRVNPKNIEALIQAGLYYIDQNRLQLNAIAKKLIRNHAEKDVENPDC